MRTLLLTLLISTPVLGNGYGGISIGHHLMSTELNDIHVTLGYQVGNTGVALFNNSFNKLSVAAYHNFETREDKGWSLGCKLGVTTGYQPVTHYKGIEYRINPSMFIGDLMVVSLPYAKLNIDDTSSIELSLLGDSVNLGYNISF